MNVLVAPLDWGLGHATRCVPVIKEIEKMGHTVMIAGSGPSLELLKIEFPSNKFFEIASYRIRFHNLFRLAIRIPSLLTIIDQEHKETAGIVSKEKIDFIISDNRYGCYHEKIPSAIITHQLSIQAPFNSIVNRYNKKFLLRFDQCWVPDTDDHALSGKLSVSNIPHKFIGPLSRMTPMEPSDHFNILGLVSGPEPQRTSFDDLLTAQLKNYSYKIVRGLPSVKNTGTNIIDHLPASELNALIASAGIVIARSGYSTIMDLAALKKKAIFVPTPGQTEQLYLAKELERKKIAPMILQENFSLQAALDRAKNYSGFQEDYFSNNLLQKTLREFLD